MLVFEAHPPTHGGIMAKLEITYCVQ